MAIYNRDPSTGELTSLTGESNIENLTSTETKELTTTATKPHSNGDYFNLNGTFVKAIDDISIGDTLTEGTNYETTNVGAELTDIESDLSTVSSNLGNKSSASAVSGSTAFAKIATLNSALTLQDISLSSWNMKSGSVSKLKIFGEVAQIYVQGETDKVFSGDMEISALSSQYFPAHTTIIPVITSGGHKLSIFFSNSKLIFRMIDNIPANTYIYVNATYLIR